MNEDGPARATFRQLTQTAASGVPSAKQGLPSSVLLLRHGQSTWNASGRWQGWADPPLSASGLRDAQALAATLRLFAISAVCSSDLRRASMTAAILASELGLPSPTVDPRLRERDVGAWTGLSDEEIEERWPGEIAKWRRSDVGAPAGGGESAETVVARMTECLVEMVLAHGPIVLAISHSGAIRATERALGNKAPPIFNLTGRWLCFDGNSLSCAVRFADVNVESADADRL